MGWANAETSMTFYIFNFVFDAGFTFLPVFVAVAAAKHFKCNMFMAALLGCALVHPNWNGIVSATDPKFIGQIFGFLPVYGMPYTSCLLYTSTLLLTVLTYFNTIIFAYLAPLFMHGESELLTHVRVKALAVVVLICMMSLLPYSQIITMILIRVFILVMIYHECLDDLLPGLFYASMLMLSLIHI